MSEQREQFEHGSSKVADYFGWINERHAIYLRRFMEGKPKPWTTDPVMLDYKFTNPFRELDKGTLALRKMEQYTAGGWNQSQSFLKPHMAGLLVFNTWWYRLYNWHEHAENLGFCGSYDDLREYMLDLHIKGKRIFTGAHMVRGVGGEKKVFPYLRLAKEIWDKREVLADRYSLCKSLFEAYTINREFFLIGDFTAYEIVCDLRWHLLKHCNDKLSWGNVGNGAVRGLKRLGLPHTAESMAYLWGIAPQYLSTEVMVSWNLAKRLKEIPDTVLWDNYSLGFRHMKPFEIREIEHSLCEFDKYERARTGQGRPRQKYDGRA